MRCIGYHRGFYAMLRADCHAGAVDAARAAASRVSMAIKAATQCFASRHGYIEAMLRMGLSMRLLIA